jgi:hypothetical protein
MAYLKMTDCLERSRMPIKVSISVPGFRSETQAQDVPNTRSQLYSLFTGFPTRRDRQRTASIPPCCIVTMLVLVSTHTDFYGNWPLDSQVKRGQTDRQTDTKMQLETQAKLWCNCLRRVATRAVRRMLSSGERGSSHGLLNISTARLCDTASPARLHSNHGPDAPNFNPFRHTYYPTAPNLRPVYGKQGPGAVSLTPLRRKHNPGEPILRLL